MGAVVSSAMSDFAHTNSDGTAVNDQDQSKPIAVAARLGIHVDQAETLIDRALRGDPNAAQRLLQAGFKKNGTPDAHSTNADLTTKTSGVAHSHESQLKHADLAQAGSGGMYGHVRSRSRPDGRARATASESHEGRVKRQAALNELNDDQIEAYESTPMSSDALERCLAILAPGGGTEINVGDFSRGLMVFGNPFSIDEVEAFKQLIKTTDVEDSFDYHELLRLRTEMMTEYHISEGVCPVPEDQKISKRKPALVKAKQRTESKNRDASNMLNNLHDQQQNGVQKLTTEQIAEFREAFHIFDVDGNGTVTTEELGTVMESLGHHMSEAELQLMIDDVDEDHTGHMSFDEFLQLMANRMSEQDSQKELEDAFRTFDQDGNGFIEADELVRVVTSMGEKLTLEEATAMLAEADANNDGKIDYQEFCEIMLG